MTPLQEYRIRRTFHRKPKIANPTQYRNRINQTAYKYKIPERKVHAAIWTPMAK